MGSIASVLQWHCEWCTLINPTERTRCIRCGTYREIQFSVKPDAATRTSRNGQVKSKYTTTGEDNAARESDTVIPISKGTAESSLRSSDKDSSLWWAFYWNWRYNVFNLLNVWSTKFPYVLLEEYVEILTAEYMLVLWHTSAGSWRPHLLHPSVMLVVCVKKNVFYRSKLLP
jgi:hypothetical protein